MTRSASLVGRRAVAACPSLTDLGTSADTDRIADSGTVTLAEAAEVVFEMLRTSEPAHVEGVAEGLHELPAMVPRSTMKALGRLVTEREQPLVLHGSKWASLRLDGCRWGALMERLRVAGVIGPGYSEEISEIMRACCRAVMDVFKANFAYTHSDEMTVILAPRRELPDGEHIDFPYKGRVQKWVSIAASVATALFNRRLMRLAAERGVQLDEDLIAHFDCHVGSFDTEEEATALLVWRAYDCSVNCAHDACCHTGAPPAVLGDHFAVKLRWLQEAGRLPMEAHQAYGAFFVQTMGEFDCLNPRTDETITVMRRVNVHANDGAGGTPRNLLNCARQGLRIVPADGEPRLALRPGSFWRYGGPSGSGEDANPDRRTNSRRKWKRMF